jgi:cytochrome P450
MNKYPDVFTEYTPPNFNINKTIYNKSLYRSFHTPIKNNNQRHILKEIYKSFLRGKEHELYIKYQQNHANNYTLSSNIIIPYYDQYNDTIRDMILLCDPLDCERIAKTHLKKSTHLKSIMSDSIISTDCNKHWQKQRKQFTMTFNPIVSLNKIVPISQNRARNCAKLLYELHKKNINININDFFLNETQAQLQLALFGTDDKFQEQTNKKIRDAFNTDAEPGYIRDTVFKFIDNINDNKFNGPLSKLLKNYEKTTDTELYGNIIVMLFAGHDTTGHTLTWLIFELCKNMKYQKILQKEVNDFWKKNGEKEINIHDFSKLKFMNLCISEILRLYPAVANGTYRQFEFDDYIHGKKNKKILVPKGTYVQIPNIFRHRNPKLWKNPLKFNPFREFTSNEIWTGNKFNGNNPESFRYSPFMYNSRSCIGKHFAQIEMRLMLLYLLREYTFILSPKQKTENIEFNRGTMGPKNGLFINIIHNKCKL